MDGLECSEIMFTEAKGAVNDARWDSEYFSKLYLKIEGTLQDKQVKPLFNECNFIKKGIFDLSPDAYKTEGVPLIRTSEIKKATINFSSTVYIDSKTHEDNAKTCLYPNDLVFTKIGAYIGDVAILPYTHNAYNFSQNVAGASLKNKSIGPYLLSFFLGKYGRTQILRSAMLSGQGKLELNDIRNYKIVVLKNDFIDEISNIFNLIEQVEDNSREAYRKAEDILKKNIGKVKDINDVSYTRTLSNSFKQSGRLDAEYYQPKYDSLFSALSILQTKKLGGENGLVSIRRSIEPGSEAYQDEGIPFVRVSDVDKFEISNPEIKLSRDVVSNIEEFFPKKNTILLSKDGSIGIAHKVQEDLEMITSGALLHLSVKDINEILPDYLTLVLNSPIVQLQAERDCNGAIIQHWKPSDIENVLIPVLDMDKQKEIATQVQESFRLRKESKRLLDVAIKAVEVAIETDENTALLWIKTQV